MPQKPAHYHRFWQCMRSVQQPFGKHCRRRDWEINEGWHARTLAAAAANVRDATALAAKSKHAKIPANKKLELEAKAKAKADKYPPKRALRASNIAGVKRRFKVAFPMPAGRGRLE